MDITNVEIKAKIDLPHFLFIKAFLDKHCTTFNGTDHQSDYYFHVPKGRLKLRIGNIEQSLIYYDRNEDEKLKTSKIKLYKPVEKPKELLETLETAIGVKVKVIKERLIYFIDHIKFHLDKIEGLGYFCEIEAISADGKISNSELSESCQYFMDQLKIKKEMLIQQSYSDMLLQKN